MRGILFGAVAAAGLLVFALTGIAQVGDSDSWHHDREAYFQGEHWHGHLFERVKEDVEHVRAMTWPNGGDKFRLSRTIRDLDDLQAKFAKHIYDDSALQRVIDALGRAASFNRMSSRERNVLVNDVVRLREYREHHADWFLEHER